MSKKLWLGFVAVFVVVAILDWIVNTMLMASAYASTMELWRPEGEIKLWVIFVCYAFFAFFFTFIFSKGYEGKGVWEGVRYGLYVSGMMAIPTAYMPTTIVIQLTTDASGMSRTLPHLVVL